MNKYLVTPKEKMYYSLLMLFSIIIYLAAAVSIIGIVYLGLFMLSLWFARGILMGTTKGNAIKLSENQFPDTYRTLVNLSQEMGLKKVPDAYVLQSGGMLNAFAAKFLGRNFVVLYSDVLELAYTQGEDAVKFVIAHELAHVKCRHVGKMFLLYPGFLFIPLLGNAYQRACEYTCDNHAYFYSNNCLDGLLVLAAGKRLYKKVNVSELLTQAKQVKGFWVRFAEIMATHPHLLKRVLKLNPAQHEYVAPQQPVEANTEVNM